MFRIAIIVLIYFLSSNHLLAQNSLSILNFENQIASEGNQHENAISFHPNCKPYSLLDMAKDPFDHLNKISDRLYHFGEKPNTDKLQITCMPLITSLAGVENAKSKFIYDTRLGGKINATMKDNLAAEIQVFSIHANFAEYWNNYSQNRQIIPGNGFAKQSNSGYASLQWNGYIAYNPSKPFSIIAGKGKNFFGDGYRSLLLSDVATFYPYLKITTTIWKLKYTNLYTNFKDIRNANGNSSLYKNKYATFHYLSFNASKNFNLSLFESVVWQSRDTLSKNALGYDVNYLNPVIFYRPTEYSLGSSDNSLVGASFRVRLFKKNQIYGQVIIDEFLLKEVKAQNGWWANKQGIQLGLKTFDIFRIANLYWQLEWNFVRPFTYAHSNTAQNYAHFNEALAHPLGANFSEWFTTLNYQKGRFLYNLKITYATIGMDSANKNFGQNIYLSNISRNSEYGNKALQGLKTNIITSQFFIAYNINKINNTRLEFGLYNRYQKNFLSNFKTSFFYLGIRTALWNTYTDY